MFLVQGVDAQRMLPELDKCARDEEVSCQVGIAVHQKEIPSIDVSEQFPDSASNW